MEGRNKLTSQVFYAGNLQVPIEIMSDKMRDQILSLIEGGNLEGKIIDINGEKYQPFLVGSNKLFFGSFIFCYRVTYPTQLQRRETYMSECIMLFNIRPVDKTFCRNEFNGVSEEKFFHLFDIKKYPDIKETRTFLEEAEQISIDTLILEADENSI